MFSTAPAQETEIKFKCYYVQTGNYNKYLSKIEFATEDATDFIVTLYKGSFRFRNKAGSIYILKKQNSPTEYLSDRTITDWSSIDEEGKVCSVQILRFKEGNLQVQCFYPDITFYFHLAPL